MHHYSTATFIQVVKVSNNRKSSWDHYIIFIKLLLQYSFIKSLMHRFICAHNVFRRTEKQAYCWDQVRKDWLQSDSFTQKEFGTIPSTFPTLESNSRFWLNLFGLLVTLMDEKKKQHELIGNE